MAIWSLSVHRFMPPLRVVTLHFPLRAGDPDGLDLFLVSWWACDPDMTNQGIIAQVGPIRASEDPGIFTTATGKGNSFEWNT